MTSTRLNSGDDVILQRLGDEAHVFDFEACASFFSPSKLNILRIHSVNDADQAKMIVGGESGG